MFCKKIILPIFVLLFCSNNLNAQTANEIIKRYINFIGGEQKWKSVKTIITSGEYDYGSIKFPFTAYAKAPNQYKFVVPLNGKYYEQAFDGKQGWKIDAFKNETTPTYLKGKEAMLMANEADVELEPAFINFQQKGHQAILEGKDSIEKKAAYKVKFIRKGGETETYYFDVATYAIIIKVAPSKNGEMQGSILNTLYSDYRDIGGIKIPFKSISRLGDQNVLIVVIDKGSVNEAISEKEFHPKY